jgi:hypothetical protein
LFFLVLFLFFLFLREPPCVLAVVTAVGAEVGVADVFVAEATGAAGAAVFAVVAGVFAEIGFATFPPGLLPELPIFLFSVKLKTRRASRS